MADQREEGENRSDISSSESDREDTLNATRGSYIQWTAPMCEQLAKLCKKHKVHIKTEVTMEAKWLIIMSSLKENSLFEALDGTKVNLTNFSEFLLVILFVSR